jgi:fatty acid desaturase
MVEIAMAQAPNDETNSPASVARSSDETGARRGFLIHLLIFAAVMLGLIVLNASGSGNWWVQWPLIGWGIGVALHGYFALGRK